MAYKRPRQAFEADLLAQTSPFVAYGTPLPPLDDHTRDDGSFVPIWKQEVTDERGRKRLHGAFTGGFSAGYFNTVGSKEGWTPSTFVSSRKNRYKDGQKAVQRPEDFMDEEDLCEAEEARTLNTSSEFAGFGTEHDPSRQAAMVDLFRPLNETIGSKLLKRMGWREGQGIGPRVKRAARLDDDDGVEPAEEHLFAPEDVRIVSYEKKTDHKGLGYEGMGSKDLEATTTSRRMQEDSAMHDDAPKDELFSARIFAPKPAQRKRMTGIGVGILNDDGSDDEDPYSMGPRISYNRVIGGDKKSTPKPKRSTTAANPLVKTKPTFISKKLANLKGALRKCHDGRLPLEGFVLAEQLGTLTIQDDKYKPPDVPAGWKSSMAKEASHRSEAEFVSTADAARASTLTAKSRGNILGESQLPGKSVFDFLTPAARERMVAASGRQDLPAAGNEVPPDGTGEGKSTSTNLQSLVPRLAPDVALQALSRGASGWMPYAEDENKRNRYRAYLEIQAGIGKSAGSEDLPPRAEGMTQDDWVTEMNEFARAAEVFKPISGLMASRFTSSSALPAANNGDLTDGTKDSLLSRPDTKPEDPAVAAAKLGMFGPMTRSVTSFYPTRLLCKRFNVPMPDHSASMAGGMGASTTSAAGKQNHTTTQPSGSFTSAGRQNDSNEVGKVEHTSRDVAHSLSQETTGSVQEIPTASARIQPDRNEALEQERPGQAVFRAIFGSDDEDD
ncbi:G patch domain-containing protein 1 [Exophiala dermatitidis]